MTVSLNFVGIRQDLPPDVLMAEGEVIQDGLDQLIAYLNLIKGSFPNSSGETNKCPRIT